MSKFIDTIEDESIKNWLKENMDEESLNREVKEGELLFIERGFDTPTYMGFVIKNQLVAKRVK